MRNDSLQEFIKLRRQLTEEKASIERRLQQINEALGDLGVTSTAAAPVAAPRAVTGRGAGKRQMSAEARARIAEAQRRRWAAQRGNQPKAEAGVGGGKPKRKMSAAGRRAIAEAAKRRWAAARAAGRNKL